MMSGFSPVSLASETIRFNRINRISNLLRELNGPAVQYAIGNQSVAIPAPRGVESNLTNSHLASLSSQAEAFIREKLVNQPRQSGEEMFSGDPKRKNPFVGRRCRAIPEPNSKAHRFAIEFGSAPHLDIKV